MSSNIDLDEAASKALGVAFLVSPTGEEQEAFSILFNKMRQDGRSSKDIVITLSGCIMDGLNHGNWPRKEI